MKRKKNNFFFKLPSIWNENNSLFFVFFLFFIYGLFFVFGYYLPIAKLIYAINGKELIKLYENKYYSIFFKKIDEKIPFLWWSVYIYVFAYFVPFLCLITFIFTLKKTNKNEHPFLYKQINHFIYSILIVNIFLAIIWILIPIEYSQNEITCRSQNYNTLNQFIFDQIRYLNKEKSIYNLVNCFPSIHASISIINALVFKKISNKINLKSFRIIHYFFWILSVLIMMTTLTTKSHYFIDPLFGFIIVIIVYWLVNKYFLYKENIFFKKINFKTK